MNDTEVKPVVLALVRHVRQMERDLVAGLTVAERAATGTAEHHLLAPKHMLSHLTAAKRRQAERLAALGGGEPPPPDHHTPEQVFEAHKDDTWPQVEAEADEVVATLTARVAALDERDLSDPDRFAWAAGEALVAPVLSNAVWHPYGHIVDFYRAHGDQARVAALHEALTREMGALDEWPALRTHALSRYNLACLSALGGETARALNLIGKALQLDPGLMENAREDHDLDPLRGDPTFAAMLASGTAS